MRLHQSLVRGRREVAHVRKVVRAQCRQHVAAVLVDRRDGRVTCGRVEQPQVYGTRRHEVLVDKDVHGIRMIDGEQTDFIEERRLPQLLRELEDVAPVARLECVTGNAQIFLRRTRWRIRRSPSAHDTDRHAQRAAPHDVGHEAELRAVPRIEEGARSLELLELEDVRVRAREINRLRHAVRPFHAEHVSLEMRAEAKVCYAACDDSRLIDVSGPNFDLRADAKRVVLSTAGTQAGELHLHCQTAVPAIVPEQMQARGVAHEQVFVSVAVDVGHGQRHGRRVTSRALHRGGQQIRAIHESAVAFIMEEEHATARDDNEVQPAVVVVVDEVCVNHTDATESLKNGRCTQIAHELATLISP